jgi:hypothetical protein
MEEKVTLLLVIEAVLSARLSLLDTPAMLKGWQGKPA